MKLTIEVTTKERDTLAAENQRLREAMEKQND